MQYDLVDIFRTHFYIKLANSKEDLQKLFSLRYEVFCKEFHFEKEEDCSNHIENDIFDPFSLHAMLHYKVDHKIAGCLRIILPQSELPPLPFSRFCLPEKSPDPQTTYAEVSRLTVAKDFRRRRWDGQIPSGMSIEKERIGKLGRHFPLPAISLVFTGAAMSRLQNLEFVYAMMEPRLVHAMASYGIYFEQIGEIAKYHGERAPFRIEPLKIWETLQTELVPLLDYIYLTISTEMKQPMDTLFPAKRRAVGDDF